MNLIANPVLKNRFIFSTQLNKELIFIALPLAIRESAVSPPNNIYTLRKFCSFYPRSFSGKSCGKCENSDRLTGNDAVPVIVFLLFSRCYVLVFEFFLLLMFRPQFVFVSDRRIIWVYNFSFCWRT